MVLIESGRQDSNLRPSAPKALDQQIATVPMRTKWGYDFSLKYLLSKWVSRIVLYAAKCCKVKHLIARGSPACDLVFKNVIQIHFFSFLIDIQPLRIEYYQSLHHREYNFCLLQHQWQLFEEPSAPSYDFRLNRVLPN